jgi:acyl carrier protein
VEVAMSATVVQTQWKTKEIEELTLELLAELLSKDAAALRAELVAKGAAMPVDSLDMFDILKEFHERTGLKIPKKKVRRETLRSVRAFAEFVAKEAKP